MTDQHQDERPIQHDHSNCKPNMEDQPMEQELREEEVIPDQCLI